MTKTDTDAALEAILLGMDKLKEAKEYIDELEQKHVMKNDKMMANGLLNDTQACMSQAVIKLRQALEAQRGGVDVEGLKYSPANVVRGMLSDDKEKYSGYKYRKGYNQAIDDLHAQGFLSGGWRDIETAPKDGIKGVLVSLDYRDDCLSDSGFSHYAIHDIYWSSGKPRMGCSSVYKPTHWMPLPQPPKKGGEG